MKLTRIIFCLMLLGVVTASCVREDLDDCFSTNRLLLSYTGDGETEIFPDKICRVEMYIFDAGNKCVSSTTLPQDQVERMTAELPPLKAGDYRIICIGNAHDTEVEDLGCGDYSGITFSSASYLSGEAVSGNDSLYYASKLYTVRPFTGKGTDDYTEVISFASSHYDLLVEVVGVPPMEDAAGYDPVIDVCGVSPRTDFENRACGTDTDYRLENDYESGRWFLSARANIMRHKDHENVDVCFRLSPDKEPLVTVNLAEFLDSHPIIDCSKHEVLIPIRIEFKSGAITIDVPEWYVEQVKPEF